MPRVATYDAPEGLGLRPTEVGISAVAGAARRVQGEYNEAAASMEEAGKRLGRGIGAAGAEAVSYLDHQQISAGAPALANLINAKSKQWDDTAKTADPNDPTVARKFIEENLNPDLDKFKSGFLTERSQQWAEARVDQFRQHMFDKTTADMSRLAADAAVVNSRQTVNALSNTVRGDPASLDFAINTYKGTVDSVVASNPNLTGVQAASLRSEKMQVGLEAIVKSAALGEIEKTGQVPSWAKDPKYSKYINGAELKQFEQAAKYYQRQNDTADRAARAEAEHSAKLSFNTAINELELSTLDPETGIPVVGPQHIKKLNEIVRNNALGASLEPGRVRTMQEGFRAAIDRMNKAQPPAAQSRVVRDTLLQQIEAGEIDGTTGGAEIFAKSTEMTDADFKYTMSAYNRSKTEAGRDINRSVSEFIKSVAPSIDKSNPLMGKLDQDGKINLDRMRWDLKNKIDQYQKAGKNPLDLMNPQHPDYMGSPDTLLKYQKSLQESIKDAASRLRGPGAPPAIVPAPAGSNAPVPGGANAATPPPAPVPVQRPPPKPGESPDAYLKRLGL